LSEESKLKFDFKPEALDDWQNWAVECMTYSNEMIKDHLLGLILLSDETANELHKVNVNSFIFKNYIDDLRPVVSIEDGKMKLEEEDIANIWKCLLTISESKKFLLDVSLSLETH
tara:strand:- start:916 stop:1260 length:345 start_codon:yes stop_codon:yes gene_type:complete